MPLEAVRAIAAREGLVILAITAEAPRRLVVACGGTMSRDAFLKRASLVAYAAFQSYAAPVEVVFEHRQGGAIQRCRVRRPDLEAYLDRRLSPSAFQARLAYQQEGPGVRIPPPPVIVAQPVLPLPAPSQSTAPVAHGESSEPAPAEEPPVVSSATPQPLAVATAPPPAAMASSPAPPTEAASPAPFASSRPNGPSGDWRAGYALGAGRVPLDAWVLEFNRPVLPSLDVRPGVWMIGAFTPTTLRGLPGATEGAALALDLLATSRRVVGPTSPSFEGGFGARATVIQGPGGGIHPAAHLRIGARWHMASVSMRYPLLSAAGDPTASWDASIGLMWPYAGGGD
jgi:hypothetical protein